METSKRQNRAFLLILTAVSLTHLLLLLIPLTRPSAPAHAVTKTVQLSLERKNQPEPAAPIQAAEAEIPLEAIPVPETPLIAKQTDEPDTDSIRMTEDPPEPVEESPRSSAQILSWQFDYVPRKPLFGRAEQQNQDRPDYYVRERSSLETVLNEPSLQLPFADTRVYLVDSYDPGFAGSVQRFFDEVTVPFGWTTKNNTRVQCAWILVIAGCSWGHNSLFQRKAKKREGLLPD
jgi:hypothetical protein